ncbi:MAG: hypothetical protein [Arizlama microvirus]|nr:MAG: hypothetical protein [Arizlama microvirus]
MKFRRRLSKKGSKKLFRKTASRYHKKNRPRTMSRGGTRL